MNVNRIVCPVDFSASSDAALIMAATVASQFDATLYIVHVEEIPRESMSAVGDESSEYQKLLDSRVPPSEDVEYEHHYLRGKVSDEIIVFAKARNVDLIVMGTHGRTGLARLLMGSVAECVVRNADCPVLSVRTLPGKTADAEAA